MKANTDKHLENLANKLMKETPLDKPSVDFTANVMSRVLVRDKLTVYKPLIPKRGWFIIFAGIISLIIYLLFSTQTNTGSWIQNIGLDNINFSFLNSFAGFKISTTSFYIIVSSTIMLLIQITLIKNYFNKRVKI